MLFLIVVLTLFVPFMAADVNAKTDAERLAEMFSPILILTEDTVSNYGEDKDRGILVLKPEPVDIMGATSAKNLRFWSVIANKKYEIDSYLNWVPPVENQLKLGASKVDFSQNKFAFFTNGLYVGNPPGSAPFGQHIIHTYFDYPGETPKVWNDTYLGSGAHAGANHPNTAYVHIYKRVIDQYKATYDSVTVVQYKYFYPYNDWWNNHEGDWQGIDVVVSSSDPNTATILGVEYRFHKVWVNYYKDWGSNPGLTTNFVFNPHESVRLIQGTHPVVYVGAGSHAAYPVGGKINVFNALEIISDRIPGSVSGDGSNEYMTHTGLVLSTQADDNHSNLWERYDLQLLPEPDLNNTDNMGLDPAMSWLGARIRWGTPSVSSPFPSANNREPGNVSPKKGPYNSNSKDWGTSKGWGELGLFDVASKLGDPFKHKDLPKGDYHHWMVLGDETWSDTVNLLGDVVVFPGATLTIEPGTIIKFEPGKDRHQFSTPRSVSDLAELFVYGTLNAEGTSTSPVRFHRKSGTPAQAGYAWGGIRIMPGGSVDLDHTTIRDTPPPPPPTDLTAQAGTAQATLRWDAYPVDASITAWQYRLKPEGVGWRDWQTMPHSGPLTAEHTVTGLIRRDLYVLGASSQPYGSRFGGGGGVGGYSAPSSAG